MPTFRRGAALLALAVAVIGAILARQGIFNSSSSSPRPPYTKGRNNTVLFLATSANGLSNVHLAAAFALQEHHPEIDVHFSSFNRRADELARVSAAGVAANPAAKPITWHELKGVDYYDIMADIFESSSAVICPPGIKGLTKWVTDLPYFMCPWDGPDHFELYGNIGTLVEEVDPAIVVIDGFLQPAMDYLRNANRFHATLAPNALSDLMAATQPYGAMFWKYPAINSGLPFPMPWSSIPINIYLQIRTILSILTSSRLTALRSYMSDRGLDRAIDLYEMHRDDVPWFAGTVAEAGLPLSHIPPNVTVCGPIVLDVAPAEKQDPELVNWLKKAPTILVNLGSSVSYTEDMADRMIRSFVPVLEQSDAQIIWKFRRIGEYTKGDAFMAPAEKYIKNGRLRLEKWLNVDPMSLLSTGHIAVSVHHGGANCYHEAVLAGVPHVILPLWADLYNFATTAEYLGIGIWPGKDTAPVWEPEALSKGFLEALQGKTSGAMRQRAKELGEVARAYGGRDAAAREIAKWAATGH